MPSWRWSRPVAAGPTCAASPSSGRARTRGRPAMTTESLSTGALTDISSMSSEIVMPYTLTAGKAIGTFLAELADHRILGSTCPSCQTVRVPAQDFCGDCGEPASELVHVPAVGELDSW